VAEQRRVAVAAATLWTGPDAPRPLDAPAVARPSDVRAWAAAMTTADRLDLHGRAESQLLLGDRVEIDEERDGWARVVVPGQPSSRDRRGYPGWVPAAQLAEAAPAGADGCAVVRVATADLLAEPGGPVLVRDVSLGSTLPVAGDVAADHVPVAVPGRVAPGWLPAAAVDLDPAPPDPDRLLDTARLLTGVGYLWGGTSGLGVDCSGLVYLAFRRYGVTVPRDAHDQGSLAGSAVEPAAATPGDLLLFARPGRPIHHVGLALGGGRMLHAPETGAHVEEVPLGDRAATLVAARRYLSGRLTASSSQG
jgi:cell wall-associated NlpC family hydrolase